MADAPTRAVQALVGTLGSVGLTAEEVLEVIDDEEAAAFISAAARQTPRQVGVIVEQRLEYRMVLSLSPEQGDTSIEELAIDALEQLDADALEAQRTEGGWEFIETYDPTGEED